MVVVDVAAVVVVGVVVIGVAVVDVVVEDVGDSGVVVVSTLHVSVSLSDKKLFRWKPVLENPLGPFPEH